MVWKDCGYVSYTKSGKQILVVLKRQRYVVKIDELKQVLDGKKDYTLIYEPPTQEVKK